MFADGFILEPADVVGQAFDEPAGIAAAAILLGDVDQFVHDSATVILMSFEILSGADDARAGGVGDALGVSYINSELARRGVAFTRQRLDDDRIPFLDDRPQAFGPLLKFGDVTLDGDFVNRLRGGLSCGGTSGGKRAVSTLRK